MPLGDSTYVNAALDALVASWPATGGTWHLFVSDPNVETVPLSVELTSGGGYAAVAFAPSDFASASGEAITVGTAISFGTSTGAYDDVATHYGITDGSGLLVWSDDLAPGSVVAVDVALTPVTIAPTISIADGG